MSPEFINSSHTNLATQRWPTLQRTCWASEAVVFIHFRKFTEIWRISILNLSTVTRPHVLNRSSPISPLDNRLACLQPQNNILRGVLEGQLLEEATTIFGKECNPITVVPGLTQFHTLKVIRSLVTVVLESVSQGLGGIFHEANCSDISINVVISFWYRLAQARWVAKISSWRSVLPQNEKNSRRKLTISLNNGRIVLRIRAGSG